MSSLAAVWVACLSPAIIWVQTANMADCCSVAILGVIFMVGITKAGDRNPAGHEFARAFLV